MYPTTAAEVRTGLVITRRWAADQETALEVEIVHHQLFTAEDGARVPLIRFTGWELVDGVRVFNDKGEPIHRVINGWPVRADEVVDVVDDLRSSYWDFTRTYGADGFNPDYNVDRPYFTFKDLA